MSISENMISSRNKAEVYPWGIGDGTRAEIRSKRKSRGQKMRETVPMDSDDSGNEFTDNEQCDNEGSAVNSQMCEPMVGDVSHDQVLDVVGDQGVKIVITPNTASSSAAPAKKVHPQESITKFWLNFEPEHEGGITQILPDSVGENAAAANKKSKDNSPQAVLSYERARTSCIKSVKRIIRECRSNNQKYTDPHFDLERDLKVTENRDCLYGLTSWDGKKDPGDVKRVTDIFEHPQFFKDGAGFDDIVQGRLGDCWFLAGLSAITANQELLRKVCVIQDQDVGVYGFVFHRDGDWHPCIIDDKLYLKAPSFDESGETVLERYGVRQKEQEDLYQKEFQKGSKALYFASCRDDNETWVPLLEKAVAKAHGDYSALDGGQVGEAIEDLTGGATTEIYTTNILNKDDFWRDLRRIGKDFIFSCHVSVFSNWRGVDDESEKKAQRKRLKGIMELHAYSVLATYEGYGQKLVKIRNPWGRAEWNGAWSDGSKEWTPEWLYRLEHQFGDDGVFWMSYEDMLKRYKYMDRTRLFGPEWQLAQEWTSTQVPWNNRDYQPTTFFINVPEDTDAVIAFSQLDRRYFKGLEGQYYFVLSFRIQKYGEDEDEDDYIARSPVNYELRRSTTIELHLEKGQYTVLFKIEATKSSSKQDIEAVIRENISRRDKITQMATLYDLAYRKGRIPKPEPEIIPTPQCPTPPAAAEEQEKKDEEKTEEKSEEKKEDQSNNDKKEESNDKSQPTPDPNPEPAPGPIPNNNNNNSNTTTNTNTSGNKFLAVLSNPDAYLPGRDLNPNEHAAVQSQVPIETAKPVPDENDPNRNPWNASCVVGLRVFSKCAELKLKVLRPGDRPDGVIFDCDDVAKGAHQEAEIASASVSNMD